MIWTVALVLLVLPRFFLIPMEDSGIRTEDFVLLLLAPSSWLLLFQDQLGMKKVIGGLVLYYGIVVASAIGAAVSERLSIVVGVAFGLRPLLYVSALYLGYRLGLLGRGGRRGLIALLRCVLLLHLGYGVCVALGLLPNVASFSSNRLSGITNGPYELSAMVCLICILLLWNRRTALAAVGFAALLGTQSRVALAAMLVHMVLRSSKRRLLGWWAIPAFAVVAVVTVAETRSWPDQISHTVSAIPELREAFTQVVQSRDDYFTAVYSEEANATIVSLEGDPSAIWRVARWSMVLATAVDTPMSFLLGMGPGYYSVALDGYYVRLIGETGILGLVAFLVLLACVYSSFQRASARRLVLALIGQLLIIALFIDIFVSLKTMCLFWMAIGALKREELEGLV